MTDYTKLVEALRSASTISSAWEKLMLDAAAAIEALQEEIKRLKDSNEELRDKQTYIDHYGDKWQTSAKDVPTAAYKHGYADGRDEAEAQLSKRCEFEKQLHSMFDHIWDCEIDHPVFHDTVGELMEAVLQAFDGCGADMRKMEVQDGQKES